ncbi:MAG: hypothetical protein ACI4RD_05385 [Kiritimatiellia bacterium]
MKKFMVVVSVCLAAILAEATQYSKLAVITAAKQAGRWDALKAWIASAGLQDEFQNCVYLSDEYPQFAAITNAIVSSGAATSQEVAAILSASKDPAVADALLRRVYDKDMGSPNGRVKWHGAVTNTVFDTNALVKVQYHADGYVHRQSFRSAAAMGIGERISAAEMKNRLEAQKKAAAAAAAKRKADRIAMLQTNLTAEVSALMKRNKWPEDLATLYLKNELNKLKGTVTVEGTITPQE